MLLIAIIYLSKDWLLPHSEKIERTTESDADIPKPKEYYSTILKTGLKTTLLRLLQPLRNINIIKLIIAS